MYVPTRKQAAKLESLLKADGLIHPASFAAAVPSSITSHNTHSITIDPIQKVGILVDTPNASKTAKLYGDQVRPDYSAVIQIASQYGLVSTQSAFAFVNPGYKNSVAWRALGYRMIRGTDHDVDHRVVSQAMELLAKGVHTLVVVSGDHRFCSVQKICQRLGVQYVAIGVPSGTSRKLRKSRIFHPLPVFHGHPVLAA